MLTSASKTTCGTCLAVIQVSQAEIDEGAASMNAFVNATDSLGRRIGAEAMGSTRINCKHAISLGE